MVQGTPMVVKEHDSSTQETHTEVEADDAGVNEQIWLREQKTLRNQ